MNELIQKLSIYSCVPIYFLGFIGNLLTVFSFISSKNFRENLTIFYLTISSIFDLGKLFLVTFSFVLPWGYDINSIISIFIFCKLRDFIFNILSLGTITCLSLASFNQYLISCSSTYRPIFANIQTAHRLMIIFGFIYTIYSIPHLFYSNYIKIKLNCQIENQKYYQYYVFSYFLVINTIIPIILIIVVGFAYRISCYKTSIFQNQLDKQLSMIVFGQILIHLCTFLPYSILNIYKLVINKTDFQLIEILTEHLVPISYASSFYVIICVSSYVRQHLKCIFYYKNFQSLESMKDYSTQEQIKNFI